MRYRIDRLTQCFLKIDSFLHEGSNANQISSFVLNPNNWEVNNYEGFLASVDKTPQDYKCFMTDHPYEEISTPEWKTFKLKGHDAGFALHYMGKGSVDICNLHNNSALKGISNLMLTFAKSQGGTKLDNYAGFLGDKYEQNGFKRYTNDPWNDKFAPKDWNYEKFGTPNYEERTNVAHDKRYANSNGYRNHFDNRMNKAFPGHNIKETRLRQIIRESIEQVLNRH